MRIGRDSLTVGQSFEVVVSSDITIDKSKREHAGIIVHEGMYLSVVIHGAWTTNAHRFVIPPQVALLREEEVRRVGKLTITKVK